MRRVTGSALLGAPVRAGSTVGSMNVPDPEPPGLESHQAALRRLPEAYVLALRLRRIGASGGLMCRLLDIEPEGLDTLLYLADTKFVAVLNDSFSA